MSLLYRYISMHFLKLFFICIISFLFVYLSIDSMSKFWKLSSREVPLVDIGKYFLFKVPLILTQITPMATLLATLLTLGLLSQNSELVAMKACGNSIYRLSMPILVISLGIGLFSLATNEYMVPYATKRYKEIERFRPGVSAEDRLFKKNNIWYFGKGVVYKIQHIDVKKEQLLNLTILELDGDYRVTRRTDAKRASWEVDHWQLSNATIRQFLPDLKTSYFDQYDFIAEETVDAFKVAEPEPEEMTFGELNQHIEKLKRMGLDYQRYVVDLAAKAAFPLVNIVFPLIGIPFGLKTGRSSGIASGVGISILVGFLYWVTMAFNISLGHVGVLPPFLAAFGSNIIFGLVGLIAFMSAET